MLRTRCSLPPKWCHFPLTYTNELSAAERLFHVSCQVLFWSPVFHWYQMLELKLASLPPRCDSLSSLGYKRNHCCDRKKNSINCLLPSCYCTAAFCCCIWSLNEKYSFHPSIKDHTNVLAPLLQVMYSFLLSFSIAHKTVLIFVVFFLLFLETTAFKSFPLHKITATNNNLAFVEWWCRLS